MIQTVQTVAMLPPYYLRYASYSADAFAALLVLTMIIYVVSFWLNFFLKLAKAAIRGG